MKVKKGVSGGGPRETGPCAMMRKEESELLIVQIPAPVLVRHLKHRLHHVHLRLVV